MPSKKPRIAITCDPYVYETIDRFASLQSRSKGAVVHDLLEAIHPPLMRTVVLLEAARDAPEEVKAELANSMLDLERDITKNLDTGLEQLDWLRANFSSRQNANLGVLDRASRDELPPYSNTGVGHDS